MPTPAINQRLEWTSKQQQHPAEQQAMTCYKKLAKSSQKAMCCTMWQEIRTEWDALKHTLCHRDALKAHWLVNTGLKAR
jgi:hypothetical protein